MARHTKRELQSEKEEKIEVSEKDISETDEKVESAGRASDIHNNQAECILQETADELNAIGQELGSNVDAEVEESAQEVDKDIEDEIKWEEERQEEADYEDNEKQKINSAITDIKNTTLENTISGDSAAHEEAEVFLTDEKTSMETARTEHTDHLKDKRDETRNIIESLKEF